MSKSREYKITTVGYVPAQTGTRLVVFNTVWDADNDACPYEQEELTVVAWAIVQNNDPIPHTWARPVASELWWDQDNHVLVYPDGRMEFTSLYSDTEFEGTTLAEFAAFTANEYRASLKGMECLDCGKRCLGDDSPILKDEIWQSIVPDGNGMLCREHMEARLGRKLTRADMRVMTRS